MHPLIHFLKQVFNNASSNVGHVAQGVAKQVNPFDGGATFANPNPSPPNQVWRPSAWEQQQMSLTPAQVSQSLGQDSPTSLQSLPNLDPKYINSHPKVVNKLLQQKNPLVYTPPTSALPVGYNLGMLPQHGFGYEDGYTNGVQDPSLDVDYGVNSPAPYATVNPQSGTRGVGGKLQGPNKYSQQKLKVMQQAYRSLR